MLEPRESDERGVQELSEPGRSMRRFDVPSARLASYAISDMGTGEASWSREDGSLSREQLVGRYGTMALRLVEAQR